MLSLIGNVRAPRSPEEQAEINSIVETFDFEDELELEARLHEAAKLLGKLSGSELRIANDAAGIRSRALASLDNDAASEKILEGTTSTDLASDTKLAPPGHLKDLK